MIEYITQGFGEPNPGFERDEKYLAERTAHKTVAGRLVAVHKLKPAAMPLREILGDQDFNRLQDMWGVGQKRHRWSVAFPIVESFEIEDAPLASEVLDGEAMKRLFAHPSATLRPFNDRERTFVSDLQIRPKAVKHQWLSIDDEFRKAELSEIPAQIAFCIGKDLAGAYEGLTEEDLVKRRKRASWLAHHFVMRRVKDGALYCDDCGFDPGTVIAGTQIKPRSLLDVHHKHPLCEGERLSTIEDFELLCPTCHRLEHSRLRASISRHRAEEPNDGPASP